MKKILITYPLPSKCLMPYKTEFDITVPQHQLSYEELEERIADFHGLFLIGGKCDARLLEAGSKLQAVANFGVGYDNIDWGYATKKNIAVINTPTQVTEATAEHCIALMMAVMRSTSYYDRFVRKGSWQTAPFSAQSSLIAGATLGIIGFGRIGRKISQKARGLGMKVIYHDKVRAEESVEKEYQAAYCTMEKLLEHSDCITLNVPYTPENYHFINRDLLKKMKKSAYLINGARGPVVEESALIEALQSGWIKGAGLDVYEFEPHISPTLLTLENVVMTPHIASAVPETRIGMAGEALKGITGVLRGGKPYNVINPQVLR